MKNFYRSLTVCFASVGIVFLFSQQSYAQAELLPITHRSYDFLKRMQVRGIVPKYNSSVLPLSRGEIAAYLKKIASSSELSQTDKDILQDLHIEFSYDFARIDSQQYGFVNDISFISIFSNEKNKHFYFFTDENASVFLDGIASLSRRAFKGDQYDNSVLLGQLGARLHGTFFNNTGFYVRFSNGQSFSGDTIDRNTAAQFDNILFSNQSFFVEKKKNFDTFEGYMRFQTDNNWLSLTLGRERILYGFGYLDKIFLSNNAIPFDFAKLDARYKAIQYSFFYGSIVGDSLQRRLSSKNIVGHRLSLNFDRMKFGFFEAITISDRPISFTFLNPISFLVSADISNADVQSSNSLMGVDVEFLPISNIAIQASLLVDDVNFATISNNDSTANDNKFGYQFGILWEDAFTIPNVTLVAEFTHIGPFVYSHRSNKSTYTNWKISLGHAIPPNSDEIAVKASYAITQRFGFSAEYKAQRSANGLRFDPVTKKLIANFGGELLRGEGDFLNKNIFLSGDRYNKNSAIVGVRFEPFRQFTIFADYSIISIDNIANKKKYTNNILNATAEVDF